MRWLRVLALLTVVLMAGYQVAAAQSYPNKQARIVVPAAAGGGTDLLARLLANYISTRTDQSFIVENRTGGGGNLGGEAVAKSAPDGRTISVVGSHQIVVHPFIFKTMPFDAKTDIIPVASIADAPQVIVINAAVPATNLSEFIAYAKSRPGQLAYASAGFGSTPHLATEAFMRLTGIDMVHVPYRGATPAVTDLIANHVQLFSISALTVMNFVKEGRLRVLVTASAKRVPHFPDVPSAVEAGIPDYQMSTWFALIAHSKTPAAIVQRLHGHVSGMLEDPDVRKRLAENYLEPMPLGHEAFKEFVRLEFLKWEKVVRESRIEPQ